MNALEFDGVRYVKVSEIARTYGYTADYLGQLCRADKLAGKLVGRSWYVSEPALQTHKSKKQRSSKAKTTTALREAIQSNEATNNKAGTSFHAKNFYSKVGPQQHKYTEDQTELIPVLSQRSEGMHSSVPVDHADAVRLAVNVEKEPYKLSPTERPELVFSGDISIVSAEEDGSEVTVELSSQQPTPVELVSQAVNPTKPVSKVLKREGLITMRRTDEVVDEAVTITSQSVRSHVKTAANNSSSNVALYAVVVLLALTLSTAQLFILNFSISTDQTIQQEYKIDIKQTALAISALI